MNSKILEYENTVFNNFLEKRKCLIENIKNFQLNNLTQPQLFNFINDVKMIIDPMKNVSDNIDFYLLNSENLFNDNSSKVNYTTFQNSILFYDLFLRTTTSSELEDSVSEISESEDSESESVSV
jgi:hypothetical protein